MKVITENEIIVQGQETSLDYMFSPASGKKGSLMDKAKGLIGSGKVSGVLSAVSNNQQGNVGPTIVNTTPPPPPAKKGMSTGVKIGIGVAAAAVVGFIIYKVVKKK